MFRNAKIKVIYITLLCSLNLCFIIQYCIYCSCHFMFFSWSQFTILNVKWSHRLQILASSTWWALEKSPFYLRFWASHQNSAACEGTAPSSTVQHSDAWIMQLSSIISFTLVHLLLCTFVLSNNGASVLQSVSHFFNVPAWFLSSNCMHTSFADSYYILFWRTRERTPHFDKWTLG